MCGINGKFSKKTIADPSFIRAMNHRIVHRGPDDEGIFTSENLVMGMRRLSIIDLSSGHQPIFNEDKKLVIVFNGEIYNYRELREGLLKRGHTFATNTDTEVVLHLYEEKKESCLKNLNGMFALAIYDRERKELFLARDRVGKKPLYYCFDGDSFLFASELKSILEVSPKKRRLSRSAMEQFFAFTFIPAPLTIFENIYKLEPGSFLKIDECLSLTKERYWHLPAVANAATIEPGYSQCSRQLKSFLYDAVEKRMISDVPLGAFLSGGIDSTIIVALMSEMSSKPVKTFTIRNSVKAYDESAKAQAVAHLYRTDHTEWTFDNDYIPDKIDGILANFDEPFADSSALPTYIVAELASRHVKVALTGDGGDELFAGYTRYLTFKYLRLFRTIPESVRNGVLKPLVNNIKFPKFLELKFNQLRKLVNNEGIEPFEQYHNLQRLGYSEADVRRFLPGLAGLAGAKALSKDIFSALEGKSDLERALVTDICIGLEGDMLVKVDRTSMLNSIEARSPFLDFRLIEHSMRIPDKYKLNGSTLKWILRNTFADKFPPEILRKPKMGFGIPVGALMRRELRSRIEELMKLDSLRATGLFDMDAMAVLFAEHCGHLDRSFRLWTFFVFASWFKKNLPFIEP